MALTPEELNELNQLIDARAGLGRGKPPKLRLVVPPTPSLLDTLSRQAHERRVTHLKRAYGLGWLVDQECFGVANMYALEDCDLIRLLNMMEHARECIVDGISFEDAGLVRSVVREPDQAAASMRRTERIADSAGVAFDAQRKSAAPLQRSEQEDAPPF